ncbi:MAG: hypothetical protein R3D03_04675 [Geminicoccaceae bacterium]
MSDHPDQGLTGSRVASSLAVYRHHHDRRADLHGHVVEEHGRYAAMLAWEHCVIDALLPDWPAFWCGHGSPASAPPHCGPLGCLWCGGGWPISATPSPMRPCWAWCWGRCWICDPLWHRRAGLLVALLLVALQQQRRLAGDTLWASSPGAPTGPGAGGAGFMESVRIDLLGFLFDVLAVTTGDLVFIEAGHVVLLLLAGHGTATPAAGNPARNWPGPRAPVLGLQLFW